MTGVLKQTGTKALGVAIGIGVALGVTVLVVYIGNYGFSLLTTLRNNN